MSGLKQESLLFFHAVLVGVIVFAAYLCLQVIRKILPHRKWMIQIEDFLYWIGMAIYLFVQIYHTNNGKIRWYSILGVVFGGVLLWNVFTLFRKGVKKMYIRIMKKFHKIY